MNDHQLLERVVGSAATHVITFGKTPESLTMMDAEGLSTGALARLSEHNYKLPDGQGGLRTITPEDLGRIARMAMRVEAAAGGTVEQQQDRAVARLNQFLARSDSPEHFREQYQALVNQATRVAAGPNPGVTDVATNATAPFMDNRASDLAVNLSGQSTTRKM